MPVHWPGSWVRRLSPCALPSIPSGLSNDQPRRRALDAVTSSRVAHPRAQEDFIPVVLEEAALIRREASRFEDPPRRHPHSFQRRRVRHRRDEQPPVVPEGDEAAIEEVVDRRRQQQPVLPVEALGVGRVAPRLAVAGAQVFLAVDAGDAAVRFDRLHALFEETLTAAGEDEGLLLGRGESGVGLDVLAEVFFLEDELGVGRRGLDEVGLAHEFSAGEGGDLFAEELGELEGVGLRELGEVDALATASEHLSVRASETGRGDPRKTGVLPVTSSLRRRLLRDSLVGMRSSNRLRAMVG